MSERSPTYYEVLGVSRHARREDIVRVHQRHRYEMQKATTPPDARRESLFQEAFDVLSDANQRHTYDRTLDRAERRRRSYRRALAGGAVAAALAAAWFGVDLLKSRSSGDRPIEEIRGEASVAVLPLHRIEVSGRSQLVGLAVAIEEGLLVTSCEGLAAGPQLIVRIGRRTEPVSVTQVDPEAGLCALRADHAGSWPMKLGSSPPRPGEKVYAARLDRKGEIVLVEGKVKRVSTAPRYVETSFKPPEAAHGAPLLDRQGRVVGVAVASGRHVPVPSTWLAENRPPPPPPAREPAEAAPETTEADLPPLPRQRVEMPAERRRAIEKAYGPPPPNIPDDL